MFEIGNEIYEVRYTMKKIEMLENATNSSVIDLMQTVPTLAKLKLLVGLGLVNSNGQALSSQRGAEVAEKIIERYGMIVAFKSAVESISEDCAFLFQEA